jgi:N-carbamoylputrescine amidase
MRTRLAATQIACSWDVEENLAAAERVVRAAAQQGANVILLQEMFATHFFAFMDWKPEYFKFAMPVQNNPILQRMSALAKELGVVLPVNFFERANNAYYNTIMMIDDEGTELGIYRKSHIPMALPVASRRSIRARVIRASRSGRPGLETLASASAGRFPESARCMCVMGADFLFYGLMSRPHQLVPMTRLRPPWPCSPGPETGSI